MKIKYCTDGFLEEFKANFDMYLPLYKNKNKKEIDLIFNSDNIKEGKIEFDYKPLKTSKNSDNPERENIKIIYESLRHLKPSQAIQEKLWVAMYNTYYQDHLFDYIDTIRDNKKFESRLESSILYTWGAKRSQIVQNISRMWWVGYYIYDEENKENPYELLDFYTSTKDIVGKTIAFFSSNLTNNKDLALGILEGLKELVDQGIIENKRKYYIETNKYFNLIGGVRILDFMTREEAKKETIDYILESEGKRLALV